MAAMKKEATQDKERLTRTLPAFRVDEKTYRYLQRRMVEERRRRISEVVRITLEDQAQQGA
jgi:hypothetical protein